MGVQKHLDLEVVCPLSGLRLAGKVIPVHKMAMMQCENGALFARCPNHVVRAFISDFTTVKQVMSEAIVLQVTNRRPRKEKTNGTT